MLKMFDFIITAIDLPAYHLDMLVNEPTAINYVIYVAPLDSNYDKGFFFPVDLFARLFFLSFFLQQIWAASFHTNNMH